MYGLSQKKKLNEEAMPRARPLFLIWKRSQDEVKSKRSGRITYFHLSKYCFWIMYIRGQHFRENFS